MKFYVDLLRELSDAFGPSNHEEQVREIISRVIKPFVSDMRVDALGNLIAHRPGTSGKRLMLDAHTDEIGIMVRHIDSRGFVKFATIGGWDDRMFPGHRVTFKSRDGHFYYGVIGMAPPHVLSPAQREKEFPPKIILLISVSILPKKLAHSERPWVIPEHLPIHSKNSKTISTSEKRLMTASVA
ncbi:MAG: hypothetical protein IPP40_00870 [bacterium]|nr:hypothetical protein [bacterium]